MTTNKDFRDVPFINCRTQLSQNFKLLDDIGTFEMFPPLTFVAPAPSV